jgi:DcmR-like sensory protein
MRTESSRRAGRFHEVGFYRSDAEFGALIVPFVEKGVAANQPVIIGYGDRKASLLRSWLSDPDAVTFIADNSLYATPARAIASYWQLFERHAAAGATQIRIAGDVPHEGNGGRFAGWDRYESAANTVWDRFPSGAGACMTPPPSLPAS